MALPGAESWITEMALEDEKLEVLAGRCPRCGAPILPWEDTWIWKGKIYCSQKCCRRAAEPSSFCEARYRARLK